MAVDKQLLGDFVTDIYSLDTLDERFNVYEKYVQLLGFDGCSYTFVPGFCMEKDSQNPPAFMFSELFPKSFLEQYTYDRFDQNDFTVRRIKAKQLAPMDWKVFEKTDELSEEEKNVIVVANNDHSVKNAISIPTMSEEIGIAGASIVSTANDADFRKLKDERLETLQICTKLFHDATVNQPISSLVHTFVMPLLTVLKPKEIVILRYIASGQHLKNISDTTDISYSYASNLLSELRQRLGGISNEKLMYIIGLFNILDHI